jgi:hypothetical protein
MRTADPDHAVEGKRVLRREVERDLEALAAAPSAAATSGTPPTSTIACNTRNSVGVNLYILPITSSGEDASSVALRTNNAATALYASPARRRAPDANGRFIVHNYWPRRNGAEENVCRSSQTISIQWHFQGAAPSAK